jgi:DNA-binding NtrC family response regulator
VLKLRRVENLKKILIVSGDSENMRALGHFLEKDFRISVSCSEESVLGLCLANNYDLVISDYVLNGTTGIALIKKVKEVQPGIKTILVSGSIIPDEGKIRRLGINAFIEKPFELEVLRDVIDLVLGK